MQASAAIAEKPTWREALDEVSRRITEDVGSDGKLETAFVFASAAYAAEYPELLTAIRSELGIETLIGCSGWGIIGPSTEIEGSPALSINAFSLPGAELQSRHLSQTDIETVRDPAGWVDALGVEPRDVNAWFIFADPFTTDIDRLLTILSETYPGVPIVGGLASGDPRSRRTHTFLNETVYGEGAVLLALGCAFTVRTVVSQGCEPIGEPWTITGAEGHVIQSIGQRPAYEVLLDTVNGLPADKRIRAQGNLLVGLAMNEYRDEFVRGDFLIRNLLGADPNGGALAVSAQPRVGQTIQFQLRDPQAADEDLRELLATARENLKGETPLAALLCACNGRGAGLFGGPHHDAKMVADELGQIPIAGFFCNGEIGPVGKRNFLHGYTASIALIVPTDVGEKNVQ